jgi:nucleotide-binding universal stress UspA family protein
LAFLHVVSTPDHPDVQGGEIPTPLGADPELEQRIIARTRAWLGEPDADVTAVEGDVVSSILDHAQLREAQLVVMGTKGLTGFTRFVMGSVAERITRTSESPVLTVR